MSTDSVREYSLRTLCTCTQIDNISTGKIEELESILQQIIPTQVDNKHRDLNGWLCKRLRKYNSDQNGRYFTEHLTSEKLKTALKKSNVKEERYSVNQYKHLIEYTYQMPLKPTIILNVKDGRFYTSKLMLEKYDLPLIALQAYIIVEILKKSDLSHAKRGKSQQIYRNSIPDLEEILKNEIIKNR